MTNDKVEIWQDLHFNVLFKGNDWRDSAKGDRLERDFAAVGVEIVYLPRALSTSSSALRKTLRSIGDSASRSLVSPLPIEAPRTA